MNVLECQICMLQWLIVSSSGHFCPFEVNITFLSAYSFLTRTPATVDTREQLHGRWTSYMCLLSPVNHSAGLLIVLVCNASPLFHLCSCVGHGNRDPGETRVRRHLQSTTTCHDAKQGKVMLTLTVRFLSFTRHFR